MILFLTLSWIWFLGIQLLERSSSIVKVNENENSILFLSEAFTAVAVVVS